MSAVFEIAAALVAAYRNKPSSVNVSEIAKDVIAEFASKPNMNKLNFSDFSSKTKTVLTSKMSSTTENMSIGLETTTKTAGFSFQAEKCKPNSIEEELFLIGSLQNENAPVKDIAIVLEALRYFKK